MPTQQSGLVSDAVSNLVGGVSQRPDVDRSPTQASEILNALLSTTEGLKKRPPSNFLHDLTAAFPSPITGLDPSWATTTPASPGVHQVTRITFPQLDPVFTVYQVEVIFNFIQYAIVFYVVQPGDTLASITASIGAMVSSRTAPVTVGSGAGFLDITATATNAAFTVTVTRSMSNVLQPPGGCFIHTYNRDVTERYVLIVVNGDLKVFSLTDGSERFVSFPDGKAYLTADSPGTEFSATTVGDFTFLVNRTVTVLDLPDVSPATVHDSLVWVRQGDYGVTYRVILDGTTFSFTSDLTHRDQVTTEYIALQLYNLINAAGPYNCYYLGSTLKIVRNDAADFTIETHDGLGDQGIQAVKGKIQRFADLPERGADGFSIQVVGDDTTAAGSFYVRYDDSDSVITDGIWKESLKGGEKIKLNPATMPWMLVRNADSTFTFKKATWNDRLVGDLTTAPYPSFLNQKLTEVFFWKNRLGLTSEENIVLSEVGEYFNFFRKSVMQLLDEDIIDVAEATEKISFIRHVVTHESECMLWGDEDQYRLLGEPLLTAKTVAIKPITSYQSSSRSKPVKVGKDVFFCADRGSATRVMEFYKDDQGQSSDAIDVTVDVPSYLVGGPLRISGGTNMDMIAVATLLNVRDLYVYNFKWNGSPSSQMYAWTGNQQIQSAWSTWRFGNSANILGVDFLENKMFLVIQRGPKVFLEVIQIIPNDADDFSDHLTYLDLRMTDSTPGVVVSFTGGRTSWTLPFNIPEDSSYPLKVCHRANASSTATDELPGLFRDADNKISATGNFVGVPVWIGTHYDFQIDFSRLYLREQSADGKVTAITDGRLAIRKLKLYYSNTGHFDVLVTPTGRATYAYTFDGADDAQSGTFSVPVIANNERVTISLKNSSHRPCSFPSLTWQGYMSMLTRRA